jgi:DNA-binding transcriptional ArsR family regulator
MSKAGETKNKILDALKERNKTLTELSDELGLSPSTVLEHIRDLVSSSEIREVVDVPRKWKYYEISSGGEDHTSGRYYSGREYQAMTSKTRGIMIPIGIVLALAVVGYLSYSLYQSLGAQNSATSLSCVAASGYNCSGSSSGTAGQLSLTIGGFNQSVQLNGIGCSYGSAQPSQFTAVSAYIPQGGQTKLNFNCQEASNIQTSSEPLHIWINYTANGVSGVAEVATVSVQPIAATTVPQPQNYSTSTTSSTTTSVPPTTVSSTTTIPITITTTVPPPVNMCGAPVWISLGGSITCDGFKAVLNDVSTPNQTGASAAEISVYESNGTLVSSYILGPKQHSKTVIDGYNVSVLVNQTTSGLYSYQKQAQIVLNASMVPIPPPIHGCNIVDTVYVGHNDTCSPFVVYLSDITQPNSTGVSDAVFNIYDNGVLTNTTVVAPNRSTTFTVKGNVLRVIVTSTYAGLYAYQKWANVYLNVTPVPPPPPQQQCNTLVVLYVSYNTTCNSFKVVLTDLGQPANGTSPAEFNVYYNNALTNVTQLYPGQTGTYTVSGSALHLFVNKTFAGLYAYQKWAKVSLNVTSVVPPPPPASGCNSFVTVYVGQYDNCTPFHVLLSDLTQPNGNGTSAAALDIYDNGALTNTTQLYPGQSSKFTVNGNVLTVIINKTFAGLYAYQKWAKVSLNVTSVVPPPPPASGCNSFITVYVGQYDNCTPFHVLLSDLTQPNGNGTSAAALDIYNNGALTNTTQLYPGQSSKFTVNGNALVIIVNKTFAGLYAYQKWAFIYTNVTQVAPPPPPSGCNVTATVYMGYNDVCSPFKAMVTDISQANSNGISNATLNIYYQGSLTNTTTIYPGQTGIFTLGGKTLNLYLNNTFAGLYYYQKWAKMRLIVT